MNAILYFIVVSPKNFHTTTILIYKGIKQLQNDLLISNSTSDCNYPQIVWNGTDFFLIWVDRADGSRFHYAQIDETGNVITQDSVLSGIDHAIRYPSLVWTGTEYGLCWIQNGVPNRALCFTRFLNPINASNERECLFESDQVLIKTSLVWRGTHFGIAWNADHDGSWGIRFTQFE